MTKKLLVISETSAGFHDKLTEKTVNAFTYANCKTDLLNFPISVDQYIPFAAQKYDQIHIVRCMNPSGLLTSLSTYVGKPQISFLLMGLSEQLRNFERWDALKVLSYHHMIQKIVIMSIDPKSCMRAAVNGGLNPAKIAVIHEPPYETREFYREIEPVTARMRLGLPLTKKIALYFGTYFFSKGPDIALEAARLCPEIDFWFVGNLSLGSISINPSDYNFPNVFFRNEYVSENAARHWFRAANVIQMPYRKFYRHDTSGIFNQAMLAQRLVVVPNFEPFSAILSAPRMNVGMMFEAENPASLAEQISSCVEPDPICYYPHFDAYLDRQNGWESIAKEALHG